MIPEIDRDVSSGYVAFLALLVATGVGIFALVRGIQGESVVQVIVWAVALLFLFVGWRRYLSVTSCISTRSERPQWSAISW